MKKYLRTSLLLTLLLLPFLIPGIQVSAQTQNKISDPVELFPGETKGLADFRVYIQQFYDFVIPASALIATVLIMIGGVIWLTSAGNQSRITKAKEYIINPIIGIILLMSAYTILSFVNPTLVNLALPEFPKLNIPGACVDLKSGDCRPKGQLNPSHTKEKLNCTDTKTHRFFAGLTCSAPEVKEFAKNKGTAAKIANCRAQNRVKLKHSDGSEVKFHPGEPRNESYAKERCEQYCEGINDRCVRGDSSVENSTGFCTCYAKVN